LKNLFLIVTVSAILSGCASFSPAAAEISSPTQGEKTVTVAAPDQAAVPAPSQEQDKPGNVDKLPNVVLTSDLMFRLLYADLSFQRGHWKSAYNSAMRVATQTRDPRVARHAAEIAVSSKQPAEALAAVRLWHDLAPRSEDATKYFLGFILISDNMAEAKPILAQRIKDVPLQQRGVMLLQIQRILAGTKDKNKAFLVLEELLAPYASMPEAHIALAQAAFNKGDRVRAEVESRQALALKPDSELAALTLAQASVDADQALRSLSIFITANPKAREARIAYARILLSQKKYELARKEFEALLAMQPQDTVILFSLGILSAQANDPKNAERYLTLYLSALDKQANDERDPAQVVLLLAQLAEERGDTETALKWLSQIEAQSENNTAYISAQIKKAQIFAKRGDFGTARKTLAMLETNEPEEQVQIILAEAQILRDANQPQAAFSVLEKGIKRHPKSTSLLYDYAMAAEKLDKLVVMEASLRQIMALEPDSQLAYNALGYSLADRNMRLNEAYQLIDKALKLAPNDAYIMDSMGWVLFRLGKPKEAEAMLRRAYELRQDAEIGTHLGEVLWVMGRKDDAKIIWREARNKDPKNEALHSTLKRLNAQP